MEKSTVPLITTVTGLDQLTQAPDDTTVNIASSSSCLLRQPHTVDLSHPVRPSDSFLACRFLLFCSLHPVQQISVQNCTF